MKTYDIDKVEQQLQKEASAAFLTSGCSMRPLLRTNKDIVVIKKAEFPLKKGDVALYKKVGVNKLVLHRIIAVNDDTYIARGDNTYHKEYVAEDDIVGVMTSLYRGGKYIDCAVSKGYRFYVKTNKFFYPLRWVWHTKIRAFLSKIKHKIKPMMLVLCLISSFAACTANKAETLENSSISDNSSQFADPSQPDSPPVNNEEKQKTAVLPKLLAVDKTVTAAGALEDAKYLQKIDELQSVLSDYSYNISLAVCSLDGSKGLFYNTNAEIFGACTVKAGYTLYACKQMEQGNGNLQTQLIYEQKHYEPGTGDMQYSPFGTVFSMETALFKSMSISDNVGYLMAVDYFGREGYNEFINGLDCPSLAIKPTVWSLRTKANDLIKVWAEIYNYFESDSEYAKFLYSSCTNTSGNYATAALSGVDYSHKQGHNSTGDWKSYSDAGIVWKGDTPYVIAILTDAPGPSALSADTFAKIIDIVHNDLF